MAPAGRAVGGRAAGDRGGLCRGGVRSLGARLQAACCGRRRGGRLESSVAKVVFEQIGKPRVRSASRVDKRLLLLGTDSSRRVNESYAVKQKLGTGGFGAVFRAESLATREVVAIKHIKKSETGDMQYLYGELESLLRLDHPNIAKFYRFFEDPQAVYLVMEFCSGGDFAELMGRGPQDVEVRQLFRDIVVALAHCHKHGVVHRDIKFENCLIQEQPQQRRVGKVIDFGLAAIRRPGDEDKWLNDTLGSRFFVAPEVVDKSVPYGTECDCWALGVMLYILLTDEHPFSEHAANMKSQQLLQTIVRRNLRTEPLDEAGVDEETRDIVLSLLKKAPEERLDAHSALFRGWLDASNGAGTASAPPWPASAAQASSARKSRTYSAPPVNLEDKLLARIRTFGSFTRFERSVLTLVAHYAEEREVRDVQAAFFQLDTTRSGSLSKEEIRQGLAACGHEQSDAESEELFRSLDGDGDGEVNYTEWLAATMRPRVLASKSAIQQLYSLFAEEGGGAVSCQRLRSVFGRDRSFSGIIGPGEPAGDATLDETQFKSLMMEIVASMERDQP